jgi:thiamine biosynthesis lipoprotein
MTLAAALLALAGPTGTGSAGPPRADEARARFLMGTTLRITVPGGAPETVFEAAFAEVDRLEDVLSNWRSGSEVSALNRTAAGAVFRCSADLYGALDRALWWAARTGGAFDPTVEPLVRALGLRLPEDGTEPGVEAGAAAGPVGWRHVRLDPDTRTARFDAAGAGVDFGGIGKGIALDAAAGRLREHGVAAALLDFGGQVLVLGAPPGEPAWRIAVADPDERRRPVESVWIRDASAATSGNSERGAGPRGGHILDPARRRAAPFEGSVTVVHPEATAADALSTALFVMGPEAGGRWAEARGVAALFLWRGPDGAPERRATPGFGRLATETTHDERAAGRTEHRVAPPRTRHGPRSGTEDGEVP